MYNLFNDYIDKYDNDNEELEQIWNEKGYEQCIKILNSFTDADWKLLVDSLPTRSIILKKRLARCINSSKNTYQLEIISQFIKIDDIDLFMTILSNLNTYNFILPQEIKNEILHQINYFMPKASVYKKIVFSLIISKLNGTPFDLNTELEKYSSRKK